MRDREIFENILFVLYKRSFIFYKLFNFLCYFQRHEQVNVAKHNRIDLEIFASTISLNVLYENLSRTILQIRFVRYIKRTIFLVALNVATFFRYNNEIFDRFYMRSSFNYLYKIILY